MKYPKKLTQRADEILATRRQAAMERQQNKLEQLRDQSPDILVVRKGLTRLFVQKGMATVQGDQDEAARMDTLISAEQERLQGLMAAANLTEADFTTAFSCPICEDRGLANGRICSCKQTVLNQLVYEQLCDVSPRGNAPLKTSILSIMTNPHGPSCSGCWKAASGMCGSFRARAETCYLQVHPASARPTFHWLLLKAWLDPAAL